IARQCTRRDPRVKAMIDRTLIDVYMYLGDFVESRRRATLASRAFMKIGDKNEIAKTRVNYANLLHRQDRHTEADRLYGQAARHFKSVGDKAAQARSIYNQANTRVQLFDFKTAEELYREAERTYIENGSELDAIDARWGLSWMHMLEGKFHIALMELNECENEYRAKNIALRVASCKLDRAEVFLNLNLFEDALAAGRDAEKQFRKLGTRYESAKASYYRARAAAALGKMRECREAIKRARKGFEADKNLGFGGAVELLGAEVATTNQIKKACLTTALSKFTRAQLPLWTAMCDLFAASHPTLSKPALKRLSRNAAVKQVPHLYAAWKVRLGDVAASSGNLRQAVKNWKQAADRLDDVRAQLPPIELRSSFSRKIENPHSRIIEAELSSDPDSAAVFAERNKTAGLWKPIQSSLELQPARRKVQDSLTDLANRVAALSMNLGAGERSLSKSKTNLAINVCQKRIRQEMLHLEQDQSSDCTQNHVILKLLKDTSKRIPVVQFHIGRKDIVAFVHINGRSRHITIPFGRDRVGRAAQQWRFLIESAALNHAMGDGYNNNSEETGFLQELGEWLWSPLEISRRHRKIMILPEGDLSNLPWHAIESGGQALSETHQLFFCPSIRHYARAAKVRVRNSRATLFVGQTDDLPLVMEELDFLESVCPYPMVTHTPCKRNDWPVDGSHKLWHYSGHASLNRDNPFYSSLLLSDGPVFATDFRLRSVRVETVTLAACESGTQVGLPGEESTGMVRSLLEMGTRNVVAGHWPVSDKSTGLWMKIFYREFFHNKTIIEAAQTASLHVKEEHKSAYHWAAFSVFGTGS
ncbi:MAG: CHAT domain-containing tetratricopeptide repeat protein, partial [candidate division Zixibacteria bacterium]